MFLAFGDLVLGLPRAGAAFRGVSCSVRVAVSGSADTGSGRTVAGLAGTEPDVQVADAAPPVAGWRSRSVSSSVVSI